MQTDMFGDFSNAEIGDSAPPMLKSSSSWIAPETIAFNEALHRGSLNDAVAILKPLKVSTLTSVLLQSGFSVPATKDRRSLISLMQSNIIEAAQKRMTGRELLDSRLAAKEAAAQKEGETTSFDPQNYSVAFLPNVKVGDFITCSDGFNYVIQSLKNESFSDKKYITASRPYGDTQNWRKGVSQLSRLTQNEAKLAKERYQVEEKSAIKNNSLALNTAVYFSSVARANSSIYEGGLIRFNGLVYQIDELIGGKYPSEVFIRQIGIESDGFNEIEKISISSGEAIAARQAFFPRVSSFDEVLARSELVYVAQHGPVVDVAIAGDMKPGDVVVDGEGKKYYAFSARFGYLEVYPFKNGKPEVFAGNSIYFHVDPGTAFAYPGRRYDPIFLQKEKSIDKINDLMQYSGIDDAINLLKEKVVENDTGIDGSESLRPRYGSEDRVDGFGGSRSGESLDAGVAQSSGGAAENRSVSGFSGSSSGSGEGRSGEHSESSPSVSTRDLADARDQRSAASSGFNGGLNSGSARPWTRYELNSLLVTDMTDEQLLQAKDVFAGSKREESINRQIQKRGLVQSVAQAPSALVEAETKKDASGVVRVPSLVSEAIAVALGWDGLSPDAKTEVLKRSGWITGSGELNFVGNRLLATSWAEINPVTQATIAKNMTVVERHSVGTGVENALGSVASLAPGREFRDSDKLNALVNPILDGDWFKLGAEEWQARNGYSGRGWSLVKDRALHPKVRNLDSQVDFMRAVIDASELARALVASVALPDVTGQAQTPIASLSSSPVVSVDRENDVAEAVAYADRLGVIGAEREETILSDLGFAWGMTADEVLDVAAVKAALLAKPNEKAVVASQSVVYANNPETYLGHKIYMGSMGSGFNVRDIKPNGKDFGSFSVGPVATKEDGRAVVDSRVPGRKTPERSARESDLFNAMLRGGKVSGDELHMANAHKSVLKLNSDDMALLRNWLPQEKNFANPSVNVVDSVIDSSPVEAKIAGTQNARSVEQKIRETLSGMKSYPVGVPFPISITHNNVTVKFMTRVDRVPTDGNTQPVIHLARIKHGRLTQWTEPGWIMNRFKLTGKDELVEEGMPAPLTDEEVQNFEANFSQSLAVQTHVDIETPTASPTEHKNTVESSPQGVPPSNTGIGRLDSRAWADEGKSGPDLVREKAQDLGKELALNIAQEVGDQDFKPSELPSVIGKWAVDAGVPIEDLRMAMLDALQKRSDISDGRMRQIRLAVDPLQMPTWSQVQAAEMQSYEDKATAGSNQLPKMAQEAIDTVAAQVEQQAQDAMLSLGSSTVQGVDDARANTVWTGLSSDVKTEILRSSGFVNNRGDLSFVGLRLLGESWKKIKIYPKAKAGVENFIEHQSDAVALARAQPVIEDVIASVEAQDFVATSGISNGLENSTKVSEEAVGAQVTQVVSSVVPVSLSEYPFGKTDLEDRFFGSVVRVLPELQGDVAWEGKVESVFSSGRLVSVRRSNDGEREYMPIRISGNRVEVLSLKDSQSVLAEKDSNIGRSWNSIYGKATITALLFPKREWSSIPAIYEYTNENGSLFRIHEDKIDETIRRNEFDASPEGLVQTAARELAYAKNVANKEAMDAKIAEIKAHDDSKLAPFFASVDYPALRIGQAKKALLAPVRLEDKIMKSYEFAEILASRDLKMEILMEDRIKPMGRMAAFRADNQAHAAHEQRVKDAGKKKVHYIGGFEVGAFEFAYAGFVRDRLHLEQAAGIPKSLEASVVDPEIDRLFTGATVKNTSVSGVLASLDLEGVDGLAVQTDAPSSQTEADVPVADTEEVATDYEITDEDAIGKGGLAEKFRDNVQAIKVLRVLDAEKRHALSDEKKALARYVGWGGLKGVFNPANKQWARQHAELRELLTEAEWDAASRSQLDSHYTSPTVVNAMYSALSRLGFENGRVLEPSVGVGNFFGMMPESMRGKSDLHGVELDILTSQIVSALYSSAKISKATGFQDYSVPYGYFDVVIGNPPFGSQSLADGKGSVYSGWSIHNYFFAKSIEMMRPGGIMPMVVSHNFLDKLDPHVRQWIARRAELVSGVRLPNNAFKENANTEVVTDVLIFKRLDYEHSLGKQELPDWMGTTNVPIQNPKTGEFENLAINNYFLKNPQNVLGENAASGSMYKANDYTVLPNGDLKAQLAQWVESLPQGIYVPFERSVADLEMSVVDIPEFVKEGSFYLHGSEVWQRLPDLSGHQRAVKWEAPNARALERMTGMIEIRDVLRSQMKMERSAHGVTNEMIEVGRKKLNRLYDSFQKSNGFLNDPTNRRIFLDDTESALIQALEFDYEKAITVSKAAELGIEPRPASAVKADIFNSRVLFPPGDIEVVENAKDALLHSLNYTGGVDMEYMQRAYGKNSEEILKELGDLLFVDPVEGLVTAESYLSGDVKTKLQEAEKSLIRSPSFSRNVEALRGIIPLDKLPSEIHVTPGSSWVPANVFNEFAREISGGDAVFTYVAATGQWLGRKVNEPDVVKNTVEFGTPSMGAMQILNLLMNSRSPEIKEKIDGKYVTDQSATEAVRQRADKIRAHWDSWVWADHERAEELTSIYNNKFNRTVERKYDGSHLTFPGMSPTIQLLSHQKNGVWRGLQNRTILLDQVVGAGKTYEGIAMLMEMRRLGITKKPLIAVPNHLTLQWRSDFYRLYPGANVLAATPQDFEKDNRERFFSKVVTGNWDAVIVGHSSLKKIPVPLEAESKIVKEQFDDISNAIQELKNSRGDRNVIKEMEIIKSNLESKIVRLKEKGGSKDKVVNFEDIGVDALFVDEMHEFKNLFFTTQMNRVSGLGNPAGSGKAFDMFVKIRWLRETYGSNAPLITATGTPVSNSLAEMFTMQRYMQYDKLKDNNLHVFDAWAKQYGDVQTVYEVAPSGNGYRLSQRFAKFKNLASLMGEYRSFADVVTLDDLKAQEVALGKSFPVPQIEGGKPMNVVAKRSALQEKFFGIPEIVRDENDGIKFQVSLETPVKVEKLGDGKFAGMRLYTQREGKETYQQFGSTYETQEEAAYAIALGAVTPVMHVDKNSIVGQFDNLSQLVKESKGKINALSLTSLANKAGLDYRLIDPSAPDFPDSKVNKAVSRIVEIGKHWEKDKGTQLIFCDLSVPLSAKSKMANKEKRIYVRDENGYLTNKLGTLHSVIGHENISYFLVADGKASSKTFTIYDSHTGQLMKEGMDSKSGAHEFVKTLLKDENGLDRWISLQEKSRRIGLDEIDEYKNEKSIDTDADSIDQEITLHDIEGATGNLGFSIYDDMRAKLIANGVPPAQIAFIHDHDTPQSKAFLFKRVNDGDVRYLFGSTPKMGAGTNVQNKLVALHHIDAPWRPSDLEQREGRIVRRGNSLYQRDPEGFKIVVNRYATAQTYDTRRWQLLEHKASGVEQLRKYSGANEIEDVATEAANSADMKAAASGNPLILKETQLSNEIKKLRLLERAHGDSEYAMNSQIRRERHFAETTGPEVVEEWKAAKEKIFGSAKGGIIATFNNKPLHNKEELMVAMDSIAKSLSAANALKILNYMGVDFGFQHKHEQNEILMTTPVGDTYRLDTFSPSGAVVRMKNWCDSVDHVIQSTEKKIAYSISVVDALQKTVGKPFTHADLLVAKIEEHGKVQRALMKSNAVAAVKPEQALEFKAAVDLQKEKLQALGFGEAVAELEMTEEVDGVGIGSEASLKVGKAVVPETLDVAVAPLIDMEPYIKVAADSISDLRKDDVYRVLVESNRVEHQADIAAYIKQERPDLVAEVESVMEDALLDQTQPHTTQTQVVLSSMIEVSHLPGDANKFNSALPGIEAVKARMVDALSIDAPEGWIVMNAPRPLLGQKTMEGDFVSGRHYAVLDPADSMANAYFKENLKLDARVLVVVPREMQMEVALHGNEYRDKYMEVEVGQRYEMLSSHLEKLRDLPYGKLSKAIVEAKGVASEGLHCGKVLSVVAGVVTQKVDRTGTNVHHDLSKLSLSVKPGDVVDISYRDGKGMVSIAGKEISAGR